jgi:tRNA pseudouridine55 synthase
LTEAKSFVLPVDKPEGPTSHDVVATARRALQERRIGHTGTLDPFASGLLLLCVGTATRISEYLTNLPKTYRAVARLDGRTLTDDSTSELIERSDRWQSLTTDNVQDAMRAQIGTILQLPPQFSAKKIAGERAYDIARRGDVATLTPARVTIHDISMLRIDLPEIEFEVDCSSGTYIRSIARDVGAVLGTGGYLTRLRRTQIGKHDVRTAVPVDELVNEARVREAALTPVAALSHLPAMELSTEQERAIRFGQSLDASYGTPGVLQLVRNGMLVAIGEADDARIRPRKVFSDA